MKKRIFSLALASTMVLGSFGTVMAADEVLVNKPFVSGYPGGTFKPDNSVTRAEVARLVQAAYDYATQNADFPDTQNHWANKYIGAVKELKGYPDGNFKPDNTMTRAEFASLMSRVNDSEIADTNKSFADIGNHWAESDIKRMASAGVIAGYEDGTFRPDQPVTRAEAVAMILRNEGINPDPDIASKVTNIFSDVKPGSWYIEEVLTASGIYKYTQDDKGNRKVVANDDIEKIESAKIVNKVITDESEDLLVEIVKNDESVPMDYASFYAEGYHFDKDKVTVKDSKGNDAPFIIEWKTIGDESVPTLVPSEMDLDEVYTITMPIGHQGNYLTTAKGTVQKVKAANAKVKSLDSIKMISYDNHDLEILSGKLVGGYLDASKDEEGEITKINATVNGGTLNLLDTDIANDVKVESSNKSILDIQRGPDGEVYFFAKFAGKATITVTYGDLKLTKEIEVVKEERKVREIKTNVSELNLLNGQSQKVVVSLFDQYGDPVCPYCLSSDEEFEIYAKENITGSPVVEISNTGRLARNEFEVTVKGIAPGTGFVYVNMSDYAYKNETKILKLPVNVTNLNTLGEKKVVVEDTEETKNYSKDFELDLNDSKDDKVLFNISQYTKEGAFAGKVKDLKFSVDNPTIIKVENGTDDNFLVTAKKSGEAEITLRDKDGNVVAKVKVTVKDTARTAEISGVNYRVDAVSDIKGNPLNAIDMYNLDRFISADVISTTVTTLESPYVRDGVVYVVDKDGNEVKVGTITVEVTTYNKDGVATKKTLRGAQIADLDQFIVELKDQDGKRKAKVSVEVASNDGTEYDKVYELDLAK